MKQTTIALLDRLLTQIHSIIVYLTIDKQLVSPLHRVGLTKQELLYSYRSHHSHLSSLLATVKDQNTVITNSFLKVIRFLQNHLQLGKVLKEFSTVRKGALLIDRDSKLQQFDSFSFSALQYREDIAAYPLFKGKNYDRTYSSITLVEDPQSQRTKQQLERLHHLIQITNAAVLTELQHSHATLRAITFGLSYPRFLVDYPEAELINSAFHRRPNVIDLKEIWNLPEKGAIGALKYVQFERITTNRLIYIPKKGVDHFNIAQPSEQSIPVRIISSGEVLLRGESGFGNCNNNTGTVSDTIILHMHGGGFIALSSSTMQNYTRTWANQLGVSVLSIDYCKPPKHRFPEPLEDAEAVYYFVVHRLHLFTNIVPKRIILAGDSAGGNLTCALMAKLLIQKQSLPCGIFLAYPAIDLRRVFSPSRLYSFSMPILHPSLLSLCLQEYLGQGNEHCQFDPFASPLLLTQEFVGGRSGDMSFPHNWPATRIIVGELDPLFDDSLRLTNRMTASNIDVHCWVYQNMSHGFLSLQKVVTHGQNGIRQSVEILRSLLKQ